MNLSTNRLNCFAAPALAAGLLGSLVSLVGCSTKGTYQQAVSEHWSPYGPVLRSDPPTATVTEMANGELAGPVVLVGVVRGVCQTKGCWMTIAAEGTDDPVFVKFRDYGFFVPRNAIGREVVLNGTPVVTEVSVQMLRHYGRDAGQSEEQVMLITEPERRLEFIADSVLIQGRGLMPPYVAAAPEVCEPEPLAGPAVPDVDDFRPSVIPGSPAAAPQAPAASGPIEIPDLDEYRTRPASGGGDLPSADVPAAEPSPEPTEPAEPAEPSEPTSDEPVGSSILDD